jgi:limonene-1,2-epoxide hydrolase
MAQPQDIVLKFFDSWKADPGALEGALRAYLSEDVVWENVGVSRTVGIQEALTFVTQFMQSMSVHHMSVDVSFVATTGNAVLTERVDYLHAADNSVIASLRVMGTLEVVNDKIVQWRDYFDTAAFKA